MASSQQAQAIEAAEHAGFQAGYTEGRKVAVLSVKQASKALYRENEQLKQALGVMSKLLAEQVEINEGWLRKATDDVDRAAR